MTPDEMRDGDGPEALTGNWSDATSPVPALWAIGAELAERLDAILAEMRRPDSIPGEFEAVCTNRDDWRERAEKAEARVAELDVSYAGIWDSRALALKKLDAAQSRVRELEAWQLAIAEPLGYVNCADGRDGFEVADAATVLAELREDRAVCICGCSDADHESYDEDGESCGIDDHECVRVCTAAAEIVARLRRAQAQQPESDGLTAQPATTENEKRLVKEGWEWFRQAARNRDRAEKAEAALQCAERAKGSAWSERDHELQMRQKAEGDALEIAEKLDKAEARVRELETMLRDLLAVIHRDGGHHTGAVGMNQSYLDAPQVVAKAHAEVDELRARVQELEAKLTGPMTRCPQCDELRLEIGELVRARDRARDFARRCLAHMDRVDRSTEFAWNSWLFERDRLAAEEDAAARSAGEFAIERKLDELSLAR